ncbi:ParB/RepB/Spo0J family partition protein [Piscinibacter koreensis]|uniref:ParB/RepB/Spo0J family partition protein n=1 Tax=Piscinibacter koreensis TaxID=2742824 RepID=A0A7Y6NTP9_9BURK|nr:ParB/RepB/Spo0J family partition protein [Schlegelella koreensis]NUZ09088.1 ParB/RepB/Spo0J family partition protein [Schlegelella koreensis]
MSSRDRLSRLTADLMGAAADGPLEPPGHDQTVSTRTPAPEVETRFPAVLPRPAGKKTGPGEQLAFRGQILAAEGETLRLKQQLERYQDSLPTRKLDPTTVKPSRWANRHDAAFTTPEFIRFKADIEHASGNVQPILVRPVESSDQLYEILFGHRRHRACLELGLPVFAAIWTEPMSEAELFAAMDRENRERADLSAWEQGTMYQRALEEQMFPSQRRLAESLGVSHTSVRKALNVAELPDPIVQCFRSPLESSTSATRRKSTRPFKPIVRVCLDELKSSASQKDFQLLPWWPRLSGSNAVVPTHSGRFAPVT